MNVNKLLGLMAEKRISQRKLAQKIGISKNTLNNKLNGKGIIDTIEAIKICEILEITDAKIKEEIFLS